MPYEHEHRGSRHDSGTPYADHRARYAGRPEPPYGDPSRYPRRGGGGIPDGLLVGVLALLLGTTVLTWTATGLAGLFAHGSWPKDLSFTRTPMAMRDLAADPTDLAGAWPGVDPAHLSGYGLFWGLFVGQLLVLAVLAVFVIGTFSRARAVRAARRSRPTAEETPPPHPGTPPEDRPSASTLAPHKAVEHRSEAASPLPSEPQKPAPSSPSPAVERTAVPATPAPMAAEATPPGAATAGEASDARSRIEDAPGALLVATSDPALWAETKDARAKIGPVHLFDPGQLCETPARLRWSPHHGCADRETAASRATALLAPLRSSRPIDAEMHTAAETLLRCWLHAAALDDRPFREVHRWANTKTSPSDPVQTLRTHPKAAPGAAGELEATLTGHPQRRAQATELVQRALAPLSQLHVRNACTATRADRVALESFIDETGTLYVVGEDPELMPILNALTQSVVEHGRRMAARSSSGRLGPPLTTVLQLPV